MWIKVTDVGGKSHLVNMEHVVGLSVWDRGGAGRTCLYLDFPVPFDELANAMYVQESLDDIAKAIGARDVAEMARMREKATEKC